MLEFFIFLPFEYEKVDLLSSVRPMEWTIVGVSQRCARLIDLAKPNLIGCANPKSGKKHDIRQL